MERIRSSVIGVAEDASIEMLNQSPPLLVETDAPIYRSLSSRLQQTTTESVSFATDGGWFQTLGLDCVLFGPGSIEVAHRANEYMPKNEFHRGAELLREIVREHCA
jgi:acetylornithine deacetylase